MARPFNYTLDKLINEHPLLGEQWDHEKNQDQLIKGKYVKAQDKYWWICKVGHSWQATLSGRLKGNGCPYCKGWLTWPGFNDLESQYPDIAAQWDHEKNGELKPSMVTPFSNRHVWWKCDLGHSFKTQVGIRTAGSKCPYCSSRKLLPGFNDLATRNLELAKQWDYAKNGDITPDMIMPHANKKFWWLCEKGHSWKEKASLRSKGCGCPYCAGRRVWPGFNDLATTNPDVASQWDYSRNGETTPEMVSAGMRRNFWWICEKGHCLEMPINRRVKTECSICNGEIILPGFNDLATIRPDLASQWDYSMNGDITPQMVSYGAHRKFWWICEKGHQWEATLSSRSSGGHGCPYCSGFKVAVGETDLAAVAPECAKMWDSEKNHGLSPSELSPHSTLRVWWKCKNGHSWMGSVRSARKYGCPLCAGYHKRITRYITY